MTKREVAEKVAKLRRLAQSSTNPHEVENARKQADKLISEHGLSESDMSTGQMGAAFDDLVTEIEKVVARSPIPKGLFDTSGVVRGVLTKIRNLNEDDKAKKLVAATVAVRMASMLMGDNKHIVELRIVFDTVLKNHGLSAIV